MTSPGPIRWWLIALLLATGCSARVSEPPIGDDARDDARHDGGSSTDGRRPVDAQPPTPDAVPASCDEGNPAGSCVERPCQTATCTVSGCVYAALPDATRCGAGAAANRCCGGACVDVSSDVANCGGCGLACGAGQGCESVALTTECDPHPDATSGRCTGCSSGLECPLSPLGVRQRCRDVAPLPNRCVPFVANQCAPGQSVIDPNLCPQFCVYP